MKGDSNLEIYNLQSILSLCEDIQQRRSQLEEKLLDFQKIINRLEESWQNSEGHDIISSIENLRIVEHNMSYNIVPCYEELAASVKSMINEIVLTGKKSYK